MIAVCVLFSLLTLLDIIKSHNNFLVLIFLVVLILSTKRIVSCSISSCQPIAFGNFPTLLFMITVCGRIPGAVKMKYIRARLPATTAAVGEKPQWRKRSTK